MKIYLCFLRIVNDWIFAYNYIMFIIWFFFNIIDVYSYICMYSLYLELSGITKLEDMTKLKVEPVY